MNNNEPRTIRIVIFFSSILTIVSTLVLVTIIGKGIYDNIQNRNNTGKISINTVDPLYSQQLLSQLVYAGTSNGSEQYYSPSIDALFTLNRGVFSVIESSNQLSLNPKGYSDVAFYNSVTVDTFNTDYIKGYKDNLIKLYPDTKIEEEGMVESLNYFKISYTKKDYFNASNKVLMKEIIVYRVIEKKIILARTTYPTSFSINQYSSNLAKLINTIQLNPQNIGLTSIVQIKNADIEITYDRKKFELEANTENTSILSYRSEDNETDTKYKYLKQIFTINTSPSNTETSTVLQTLKQYRDVEESTYKNNEFEVLKDNYKQIIGNREFTASDYKYDYLGKTHLITLAVGKAPFSSNYVILKTSVLENQSRGYEDTIELIKNIRFKQLTDTQSTLYPLDSEGSITDKVLGTSSLDIDKTAIIAKPGIVRIYTKACVEASLKSDESLVNSMGKKYSYCYGILGSGFFVSAEGYLVTNGHVVIPNELDLITTDLTQSFQTTEFWNDMTFEGLNLLKKQGYDITTLSKKEKITVALKFVKHLIDTGSLTLTPVYQNYIEGEKPLEIDASTYNVINGISVKFIDGQVNSATLASLAATSNQPASVINPDLAILKASESSNYPALTLSDPKLIKTGENIQIIGFPNSLNNYNIFGTHNTISTITNNTITGVKASGNGTFKILQMDKAISQGNNGAPILNSQGNVVGIATYRIDGNETTDFNTGISVEDISNILKKNNIALTNSSVSKDITNGIENFSKGYYKLAVTNFNEAIKLYPPTTILLTPMISIAQEKINQGKDQTPPIDTLTIEALLESYGIHLTGYGTLILIITLIAFVILASITLIAILINRKRMLSQTTPIVGNADLSFLNSQIRNHTDYSIPQDQKIDISSEKTNTTQPVAPDQNEPTTPIITLTPGSNELPPLPNPLPTTPIEMTTSSLSQATIISGPEIIPTPQNTISETSQPFLENNATPTTLEVKPISNTTEAENKILQSDTTTPIPNIPTNSVPLNLTSSYNPLPSTPIIPPVTPIPSPTTPTNPTNSIYP